MRRNRNRRQTGRSGGGTVRSVLGRLLSLLLVLAVVVAAATALVPFPVPVEREVCGDYGNWMRETLPDNIRIVDVAMPGSHDSLTYEVDFTSPVDELSAEKAFTNPVLRGLAVRQSKTQELTVKEQLEGGVRYLDLRATYRQEDKTWYGVHNLESVALEDALEEVHTFLITHPGEVVILDFQHCYDSREADGIAGVTGTEELYALLGESGLTYLMAENISLASATYGSLTSNGARSAALVLMKETAGKADLLPRSESITSVWYNTDRTEKVYEGLNQTAQQIESGIHSSDGFRVQQVVLTMQASVPGVLKSIQTWSLLDRAEGMNQGWLSEAGAQTPTEEAFGWLQAMPIVMMDNAAVGDTGRQVMELILAYNQGLS